MFGKIYVGHEVIMRKGFSKLNYGNNSISCCFTKYFFISRKCTLLLKDKNGMYMSFNTHNKYNLIDPNNFLEETNTMSCIYCDMNKNNSTDCDLKENAPDKLIGVVSVQPLLSYTRTSDLHLALSLINQYNMTIDKDDEYVRVDDCTYNDVIREIDDGIGIKKIRKN